MVSQRELAIQNIVARLKYLQYGNTPFTYNSYELDANGEFVQDANGNDIIKTFSLTPCVERVASYHSSFQALLNEFRVAKSAIGIKYWGSQAKPCAPLPAPMPSYRGDVRNQLYSVTAKYLVLAYLNLGITQADQIEGTKREGIFDTLQKIQILLDGFIPCPSSLPLNYLGDQVPVEIKLQDQGLGAVIYGATYQHTYWFRSVQTYKGDGDSISTSLVFNNNLNDTTGTSREFNPTTLSTEPVDLETGDRFYNIGVNQFSQY